MACLHEMTEPITPSSLTRLRPALESLQGNILRAHGRDHARHIFLRFVAGKQREVKDWIHDLASTQITSAQRQIEEGARYRYGRTPGRLFVTFLLSTTGYQALGADVSPFDEAFRYGMQAARHRLNDPPRARWEAGYRL
ncbi:MAG TPA: hypothetical protein VI542_21610 [Candidatus Tectomicrobia bacterium]